MIHISVIELGVACGLFLLVILIPLIIKRGYGRLNKRVQKIEEALEKKR